MLRYLPIVCLLLLASGCGDGSSGQGQPSGQAPPNDQAKAGAGGLGAPGNDPAVVALARKALACKFEDESFDSECADFKQWSESKLFLDVKKQPALISMLEDEDPKVRALAEDAFDGMNLEDARAHATDSALAGRLIAVAESGKLGDSSIATTVGTEIGLVHLKETGTEARVKALFGKGAAKLQVGMVKFLLKTNPDEPLALELTKGALKSGDRTVRGEAAMALGRGGAGTAAEACKAIASVLPDQDKWVAGVAANTIAMRKAACGSELDALLADLETRAKAGTISVNHTSAIQALLRPPALAEPQKERVVAITKAIAENSAVEALVRVSCLKTAHAEDKTFASKLEKDAEPMVAKAAKELAGN